MAKKAFGKLAALLTIAGAAAAGISYLTKYRSFNKELDEDFHDFEDEDETEVPDSTMSRNYVSLHADKDEFLVAAGDMMNAAKDAASAAKNMVKDAAAIVADNTREAVSVARDGAQKAAASAEDTVEKAESAAEDAVIKTADAMESAVETVCFRRRGLCHNSQRRHRGITSCITQKEGHGVFLLSISCFFIS